MTVDYNAVYGKLRQKILAQNFAIGRHFRTNYMANGFKYGTLNLEIPTSRNRVLNLIELKCLKKGAMIGGDDVDLFVTVENMKRPTLKKHMDDSGNQIWPLNINYKMSQFSTVALELQREKTLASNEVIGSVSITGNQITAPDVSVIFDNGGCRYELHYQVHKLVPAEVGLLEGGGGLDDLPIIKAGPEDDWHVAVHGRENPLISTGELLTCLAIEYYLGNQETLKLISSTLASIGSLYKFNGNHFDGYIIRWDAVTSDFWQEDFTSGTALPKRCLNFLMDAQGKYLYCTPFDSPDYVTPDNDDNVRWPYLQRYRHWEPSMDEINGLMMGYDAVYRLVNVQDIRDSVRIQVNHLGDYLAEYAYHLVRPLGGFAERGSAGPNPAMEYPFSQAFHRITGNAYAIRHNWEDAATAAGVWQQIQTSVNTLENGYIAAAAASLLIGGGIVSVIAPFLTPVLGLIGLGLTDIGLLTQVSPFNLARAAAIYQNREYFDVKHTQYKDSGERESFVLSYILSQIPPQERTSLFLTGVNRGIGNWAREFPRYWGINAAQFPNQSDNSDPLLRTGYLGWNEAFYQRWLSNQDNSNHAGLILDCALAMLNGGGPLYEARLVNMLNDATLYNPPDGAGPVGDQELRYLCAIAVAWLYVKLQKEQGITVQFPGLPPLPDPTTWPSPSVPIAPDTYCVIADAINQSLSAYQGVKGRNVDFGTVTLGAPGGNAFILVGFPDDFTPRPLDSLQPLCNHDQLAVDDNNQAQVFAGDSPVQKSPEPVIHATPELRYRVLASFSLTGDFNSSNLEVSILPDDCQFSYNQPAIVGLSFHPPAPGQFSGSLILATDNPYLPSITFALTAQAVAPAAPQLQHGPLDFGDVNLGATSLKNIVVENIGTDRVYCSLNDEPFDQTPADQFKVYGPLPQYYQLNPGEMAEIQILYTPTAAGPAQARLDLEYNFAGHVPTQYELEMTLQASGVAPTLALSADSLDFQNNNPTRVDQHQSVTITGKTACPVTVTRIYLEPLDDPAFYVHQEPELNYFPLPVTLQQNASINVDILFFPITPGETYHAKLHILSDDLLLPIREMIISGGAAGALSKIAWPDRIDFGTVSLAMLVHQGLLDHLHQFHPIQPPVVIPNPDPFSHPGPVKPFPKPQPPKPPHVSVRIKSQGTSDLVVSQIYFDPPVDAFALSGLPAAFPITLTPGAEQDFDVDFIPTQTGTFQTQLKIVSNDAFNQHPQNSVTGVCKP